MGALNLVIVRWLHQDILRVGLSIVNVNDIALTDYREVNIKHTSRDINIRMLLT